MASKCTGDCLNIKSDAACVRPGTTYANLYKWPVAEAEFVRSISQGGSQRRSTVVDGISCRQMYLRSYTFSTKEENKGGGDQDGDDDGCQRNQRRCFAGGGGGRKKTANNGMGTSKTMSFVVRVLWKCLTCTSSTRVNVEE
ncbi:unnamed protein product [Microthlaspi erraticum]|uniref:Uncharacterized protein n=1 Tax=Microthlaspi erraticum TaxID=1685480 RepID=A0A6D2J1A8_9BRAS|nr:unnamed protein product [Microthlaspi erraticum]